jgi:hypothetical protein
MKSLASLCLALLVLAGVAANSRAEEFRTDINPALLYYQAFILTDLPKEDVHYLFESQDWMRGERLPDRFGKLVSSYNKELQYAHRAAQSTVPCDWGIDLNPGPNTLLPHLAKCKRLAQAGRLHAMWALQQGRQDDARDDLLACLALGRNTSRDGTLIAALVQLAIENIVTSTIAENFFQLSPETLKQLNDGIASAPARGTMASRIPIEKVFFMEWLLKHSQKLQAEYPGDDAKVLAGMHELVGFLEMPDESDPQSIRTNLWPQTLQVAGGTSTGVIRLIAGMAPLYDELTRIMSLPHADYEAQMKAFRAKVDGSTNPLVPASFPAFEKCRPKEDVALAQLAMVHAATEYKLHGEAGFKRVPDPFGTGPFAFERFSFEGVDRGFQLTSVYQTQGAPVTMIFVEKDGPAFRVTGPRTGQGLKARAK